MSASRKRKEYRAGSKIAAAMRRILPGMLLCACFISAAVMHAPAAVYGEGLPAAVGVTPASAGDPSAAEEELREELRTLEITAQMKGYLELDFSGQDAGRVRELPERSVVRDHIREGEHFVYDLTGRYPFLIDNELIQIVADNRECVLEVTYETHSEYGRDCFTTDRCDTAFISFFKQGKKPDSLHVISLSGESSFTIYRVCADRPVDITAFDSVSDCFAGAYEILNYRLTCSESGMYRLAADDPENCMFSVFDSWENRVVGSTVPGEAGRLSLPYGPEEDGTLDIWLEKGCLYRIAAASKGKPGPMRFELLRYSEEKQEQTGERPLPLHESYPEENVKFRVGEDLAEGIYLLSGGLLREEINMPIYGRRSTLEEIRPLEINGIRKRDMMAGIYIPVLAYCMFRDGTAWIMRDVHFAWDRSQ